MGEVYRTSPPEPQYLCIVCYEHTASHAQDCPKCNAPMAPLESAQSDLRARAEERKKSINGRRNRILLPASFILAFLVEGLLFAVHVLDWKVDKVGGWSRGSSSFYVFLIPAGLAVLFYGLLDKLTKNWAALGANVTIEPSRATTGELLAFLGTHQDS